MISTEALRNMAGYLSGLSSPSVVLATTTFAHKAFPLILRRMVLLSFYELSCHAGIAYGKNCGLHQSHG